MNINNLRGIFLYIKSDYARYGENASLFKILWAVVSNENHSFNYCFWLRLSSAKHLFYPIAKMMHKRLSIKYGIQIYASTQIEYGLCLGHGVNIVVNPTTVIGNNCNLSHSTTIGSNHGQAAIIGDNVYIGPSVCIVEDVYIGNNVTIGAGAVVVKDIPDSATAAGVPAKIISYKNPGRYVRNRCEDIIKF